MDKIRLRDKLRADRAALPTATLTDTELGAYSVVLRDINGNIVDKQPLSRLRTMLNNHLTANAYLIGEAINKREKDTVPNNA